MSNAANNLVHESETQRQYVRVSLPARAKVGDKEYIVTDLSSGGMSLQNAGDDFDKDKDVNTLLILPFKSFSIDIELNAEVRHVNQNSKTVGFRFVNLTPEQTSLLNHVLRSFIAGEIVSGSDLLAVVSRENFVKVRHHSDVESDKSTFWKRQAIPFFFIALLGLSALFIIVKNVYHGLFVLQSSQGYVSGNEIEMRTPVDGVFATELAANITTIQKGELIGNIQPFNTSQVSNSMNIGAIIKSPCNCIVLEQNVDNGEFVTKGSEIITMVDRADTPWVTAIVSTQDAQRVLVGDTATILVAGQDVEVKGTVEGFSVNEAGGPVVTATQGFDTGVKIRVKPEQKLPIDLVGRPARILFDL